MSPFSRMQVRTDQRIINSPVFYFPFFITISSDYNRTVLQQIEDVEMTFCCLSDNSQSLFLLNSLQTKLVKATLV